MICGGTLVCRQSSWKQTRVKIRFISWEQWKQSSRTDPRFFSSRWSVHHSIFRENSIKQQIWVESKLFANSSDLFMGTRAQVAQATILNSLWLPTSTQCTNSMKRVNWAGHGRGIWDTLEGNWLCGHRIEMPDRTECTAENGRENKRHIKNSSRQRRPTIDEKHVNFDFAIPLVQYYVACIAPAPMHRLWTHTIFFSFFFARWHWNSRRIRWLKHFGIVYEPLFYVN